MSHDDPGDPLGKRFSFCLILPIQKKKKSRCSFHLNLAENNKSRPVLHGLKPRFQFEDLFIHYCFEFETVSRFLEGEVNTGRRASKGPQDAGEM